MLYIGLLLSNVDKNETEIVAELGARLSVNKSFFQKANGIREVRKENLKG